MENDDSFYGVLGLILGDVLAHVTSEDTAEKVKDAVIDRVMTELGGQQLYIPKKRLGGFKTRNQAIRGAFNGTNYAALARRWLLSERRIRDIVDGRD